MLLQVYKNNNTHTVYRLQLTINLKESANREREMERGGEHTLAAQDPHIKYSHISQHTLRILIHSLTHPIAFQGGGAVLLPLTKAVAAFALVENIW